jgi:hypothetical protein
MALLRQLESGWTKVAGPRDPVQSHWRAKYVVAEKQKPEAKGDAKVQRDHLDEVEVLLRMQGMQRGNACSCIVAVG